MVDACCSDVIPSWVNFKLVHRGNTDEHSGTQKKHRSPGRVRAEPPIGGRAERGPSGHRDDLCFPCVSLWLTIPVPYDPLSVVYTRADQMRE
jgi:hypothetical protein